MSQGDNTDYQVRDSLQSIKRRHLALMRESLHAKGSEFTDVVVRFIMDISRSGDGLEAEDDRSTAQNLLDYWNATLMSLSRGDVKEGIPTELMSFAGGRGGESYPRGENPFRSSGPLRDHDLFFDREDAIRAIVRILSKHPIVFLSGPVGSGRSSLIFAGVLPRLMAADSSRRVVMLSLHGGDPVRSLCKAVGGTTVAALTRSPEKFHERVAEDFGDSQILFVIDNADDLFVQCADLEKRGVFAKAVASLAVEPRRHSVVLVVRDDWLAELCDLDGLKAHAAESAQYSIAPLTAAELRIILQGSVQSAGLRIDLDCLNELIRELQGDPGSLSLARFMLFHLWSLSKGGFIGWEAYRQLGPPHLALAKIAESVFAKLSPLGAAAAQRLFLSLIKPGLGSVASCERESRRRLEESGRDLGMREALDAFLQAGVIREGAPSDSSDDSVEVIHSSIAVRWGRLARWLEKLRYDSERRGRIFATARLWQRSGRQPRYLFRDQTSIDEARDYLDATPGSQVLKNFITESVRALDRSRRLVTIVTIGVSAIFLSLLVWIFWHHWYQKEMIAEHVQVLKALAREDDLSGQTKTDSEKLKAERHELESIHKLRQYGNAQVDLSNARLHDLNEDLSLDDIDFSNTRFFTTLIRKVNFNSKKSNLRDLSQIPFDDSVIIDSSFNFSNLSFSDFSGARIYGTSFLNANLFKVAFDRAELCDIDFTGANLRLATFWNAFVDKPTLMSLGSTAWWLASGWRAEERHALLAVPPIELAQTPTFLADRKEREDVVSSALSSDPFARANALNNLAWLLAVNKVDLAKSSSEAALCGQDNSIPKTARAAVTEALCIIDKRDPAETKILRSKLQDTMGYILLQIDEKDAALPLLKSAFENGDRTQRREILFRLSVAENAVGDSGALSDMRKSVVELGYVPTHEFLTLRKYLAVNNFGAALDDALRTLYPERVKEALQAPQPEHNGSEDCGLSDLAIGK
jgi:hypothetical protein